MCSLSAAGDWRSSPFAAAMSSLSFGSRMSVKRSRCQQRQPSERRLLRRCTLLGGPMVAAVAA